MGHQAYGHCPSGPLKQKKGPQTLPELQMVRQIKTGLGMTNGSFWTVTEVGPPIILTEGGVFVKIPDDKIPVPSEVSLLPRCTANTRAYVARDDLHFGDGPSEMDGETF